MDAHKFMAAMAANAERTSKPVPVTIDGIGTVYVRKRTVGEYEAMVREAKESPEGGVLSRSAVELVCDENGERYPADMLTEMAELFAKQPHDVFRKLTNASDGTEAVAPN